MVIMWQVLSAHFRAYIQALEKLQLDIAGPTDLIGVDTRSTSLFSRGREPLKNRSAIFALGDRINILKVFFFNFFLFQVIVVCFLASWHLSYVCLLLIYIGN